jgi:hypothetical protein
MTSRQRLPNRRASENYTFECGGLMYTATIARFPDGRIGEVFLNNHKTNSGADVATRDSAIVLSFASRECRHFTAKESRSKLEV